MNSCGYPLFKIAEILYYGNNSGFYPILSYDKKFCYEEDLCSKRSLTQSTRFSTANY